MKRKQGLLFYYTLSKTPLLNTKINAKLNGNTSEAKIVLFFGTAHININGIIINVTTKHLTNLVPVHSHNHFSKFKITPIETSRH